MLFVGSFISPWNRLDRSGHVSLIDVVQATFLARVSCLRHGIEDLIIAACAVLAQISNQVFIPRLAIY